jgi:predicted deacylase
LHNFLEFCPLTENEAKMIIEDLDIERDVTPGTMKRFDIEISKLPSGTTVNLHVFIYRGKEKGPTLMVSGGLHGDEVNGIEIVRRLMQRGTIVPDAGTVIAIPIINIYGFLNFARELPDGKDANRSFPGSKNGSLASRVAWNVQKKILPLIDYGLDFHTGGGNRSNYPQVRCDFSDEVSLGLAKALAPPFIIHSSLIPASLRNEAKVQGKTIIVYEAGQSLRFDEFSISEAMNGTERLMYSLGMLKEEPKHAYADPIMLSKTTWVRAENAGLFNHNISNGILLETNELIGTIHDPYNEYVTRIASPVQGYVIGLNYSPVINAGDALVHIGTSEHISRSGS